MIKKDYLVEHRKTHHNPPYVFLLSHHNQNPKSRIVVRFAFCEARFKFMEVDLITFLLSFHLPMNSRKHFKWIKKWSALSLRGYGYNRRNYHKTRYVIPTLLLLISEEWLYLSLHFHAWCTTENMSAQTWYIVKTLPQISMTNRNGSSKLELRCKKRTYVM